MMHYLRGKEGKSHQHLDSCERTRHLSRTDVFLYGRSEFQHKKQIYRFNKKINNSRLGRVVSIVKMNTAPIGFPRYKQV